MSDDHMAESRQYLSQGTDWNFDLFDLYDREIGRVAAHDGLDTYPNQIEMITSEQMMDAYSSVGMPLGYNHWSFGKQFVATQKGYKRGQMGLAYEIVINSSPCIAYLMEENTMTMQALVIAHASYGHNSFFKGNYLFRTWTDAEGILDYLVFARNYVAECEERYGDEAVEEVLDSCHALMNHGVDRYVRPAKLSMAKEKTASASGRNICSPRSTTCGAHCRPGRRWKSQQSSAVSPPSHRRTCFTSSRRTRRAWSPGSVRSSVSSGRSLNISIPSGRPRS